MNLRFAVAAICLMTWMLESRAFAGTTAVHQLADGSWELTRNGQPWSVRGIGRKTNLALAVECGVNTARTYGASKSAQGDPELAFLDEAHQHGLAVISGIKLRREGRNFSYENPSDLERQREEVRAAVRERRSHPALLMWGLGNETEGPRTKAVQPALWKELEVLARIIREEDPDHPIMIAIAGPASWRVQAVRDFCPSIDILGVNAYGEAAGIARHLDEAGWTKPFILTEFGPRGHWEVPFTEWNARVEPSSEEKAENYARGFRGAQGDPKGRFLGAVCFAWGYKQEITGTWYGMFLATGEKTPAVDVISRLFAGQWPENRSPHIVSLSSPLAGKKVSPEQDFPVALEVRDHEDDPLSIEWKVVRESGTDWAEGNREPVPPTVPGAISPGTDPRTATIHTPTRAGGYRAFVFVRDGKGGGATQNFPFYVQEH